MKKFFDKRIAAEIRLISGALILLLGALVYLYQRVFLPAYFFTDERTILDLIRYTDLHLAEQNSFVSMAVIFSFLGQAGSQLLLVSATALVMIFVSKRSFRFVDLVFACVLMASFALFNLKLSKEVVVILLNLAVCLICSWRLSNHSKIGLTVAIYLLYAWQFRIYYVLIAGILLALHMVASSHGKLRAVIVLGILAACLALPGDFWNQLQQARDIVNENREGMADAKTVFTNILTPNGVLTALPNVGFATIRFYFAPVFSLRAQELILSFTLWYLTFVLFRRRNYQHPLFLLLLANFAVQTFFEPDLGSFFRHLTAYAFCVFGIDYLQPAQEELARRFPAARPVYFSREA